MSNEDHQLVKNLQQMANLAGKTSRKVRLTLLMAAERIQALNMRLDQQPQPEPQPTEQPASTPVN